MSVTERAPGAVSPGEETALAGWGRVGPSRARVISPRGVEGVMHELGSPEAPASGVIARGAGRSYGDAAQLDGGRVLDMTGLNRVSSIDPERRLITAEAGATLGQLSHALAAYRLALPVLPGTRHVTLGGAIASDIHGKNHHRDGGFARCVRAMTLCTPALGCVEVTPASDAPLFYATLGGMGLTGVVTEATLAVEELPSPWLALDTDRTDSFAHTLELMRGPETHRYSVAWLDLLARGGRLGRGVVLRAERMSAQDAPAGPRQRYPDDLLWSPRVSVPRGFPGGLLRESAVRAFNALHWRAAPRSERGRPRALTPYFFPLDWVGAWHRMYGAGGLMQYQLVLPHGEEEALVRCVELMSARRLPIYLAVFKQLGEQFGGPLSFPLAGWTLAVDLPAAAAGAEATLAELDELVLASGGRVYLTKDARLRGELLGAMYPRLPEFLAQRERVDPDGMLRSDLARRVGLAGAAR